MDVFSQRFSHVNLLDFKHFALSGVASRQSASCGNATDVDSLCLAEFEASMQAELMRFFQVGGICRKSLQASISQVRIYIIICQVVNSIWPAAGNISLEATPESDAVTVVGRESQPQPGRDHHESRAPGHTKATSQSDHSNRKDWLAFSQASPVNTTPVFL